MRVNEKYYNFITKTFLNERFCILQGGKRAGKTFAILQYIYIDLIQRAGRQALIVTDTFARLQESIFADFAEIVKDAPECTTTIKSGTPRIEFYNGSLISFCCADRDARGYTSNKNYIFFNEAIMYGEDVARDILKAGADDCRVFIDYNPFTRFWVNDKYETPTNKLITSYKDNPFCPLFARLQLEQQEAKGKDAKSGTMERYLYDVECCGVDAELAGLCFTNVEVIDDAEYESNESEEVLGSDWGQVAASADPDVIIGVKKYGDKGLMVKEYFYSNEATDEDIAEVLKSINFDRQFFVFETATGGKNRIQNIYVKCGLRFRFTECVKPPLMLSIRNMQSVKLYITKESLNIWNEQRNYKYVKKNDIMQPCDAYNHAFDALRYVYNFMTNAGRL